MHHAPALSLAKHQPGGRSGHESVLNFRFLTTEGILRAELTAGAQVATGSTLGSGMLSRENLQK